MFIIDDLSIIQTIKSQNLVLLEVTFVLGVDNTSDGFNVKLLGNVFSALPIVPRSHGTSGTI